MPSRADIDPTDFPELLGHINIIEVLREDGEILFRYSLWGTLVTELYGHDFTGRYIDEIIIPTRAETLRQVFLWVVETGQPHFWQIPVPVENRDFLSNRRLLLPLATDGVTVDRMLALLIGDRRPKTLPD